jgi:ketosteroid isomerase-like protein
MAHRSLIGSSIRARAPSRNRGAVWDDCAVHDHERLVDEFRQALQQRDADRIASLLHPDVRLTLYSAPEPISGRDAAHEWYRKAFERRIVFEGTATVAEAEPDAMLLRGRIYWYEPNEGGRDQPGEWLMTFRDGLIASIDARTPSA